MSAQVDALARWLIAHAARSAPPSLSQRLEEEWLADLAERPAGAERLRLAVGCCWATKVIAHEFAAAGAPVRSAATGHESMTLYAQHDSTFFSRRTAVVLAIAALHAMLIYAITNLVRQQSEVSPPPLTVVLTPDGPVRAPPPPPRPPNLTPQRVEAPQPDFAVSAPADANPITVVPEPGPAAHPPPPRAVSRVPGGPGEGFPVTEDFYPAAARRLGESGAASVRVCVDRSGRLSADPAIEQSSGSARLDDGALRLARAGSGHYRPTTEDGRPVSSCYPFRIRFMFRN